MRHVTTTKMRFHLRRVLRQAKEETPKLTLLIGKRSKILKKCNRVYRQVKEWKRGPHTFRHAHAVSLLRAAVPLKALGGLRLRPGPIASWLPRTYAPLGSKFLRG